MRTPRLFFISVALVLAILQLASLGLVCVETKPIVLKAEYFKDSSDRGFRMYRLSGRNARLFGLPMQIKLMADEASFSEVQSAVKLREATGPAFRIKGAEFLYVNDAIWKVIQKADPPVMLKYTARPIGMKVLQFTTAVSVLWAVIALLNWFSRSQAGAPIAGFHRRPALDALRGVAAFVVMLCHALWLLFPEHWFTVVTTGDSLMAAPKFPELIKLTPIAILLNGSLSVHVFWVLSGLVLSLPLLAKGSIAGVSLSAAKRYFRLVPLAFITTVASFGIHVIGGYEIIKRYSNETGANALNIAVSVPQPPGILGAIVDGLFLKNTFNGPLWTIGLELLGSMVLFGVIALTLEVRKRRIVWLTLWGVFCFVTKDVYLGEFIAGLLIADLSLNRKEAGVDLGPFSTFILGLLAVLLGSMNPGWVNHWFLHVPRYVDQLICMAAAILLVGLASCSSSFIRLLSYSWLVWLGERSFAMYVVHALTIVVVGKNVAIWCISMGGDVVTSGAIGLAIYIGVTLWLSDLLTKWVDVPSMKMAGAVGKWLVASIPERDRISPELRR